MNKQSSGALAQLLWETNARILMKPSSALILDQDGIILLHRAQDGWRVIGQADPTDPDLDQKMKYLRRTALDLAGGKFATKLVIPNSQILYTRLDVPPANGDRLASDLRAALEGLTPYDVDQLAFDWQENSPGKIDFAVVAEETLAEAEAFAEYHKFNPLCFVSIPDEGAFEGEPSFGQCAAAHRLLSPGAKVEANAAPIDVKALIARYDEDQAGVDTPEHQDAVTARDSEKPQDPTPTFATRRAGTDNPDEAAPAAPLDLKFVAPQLADDRPAASLWPHPADTSSPPATGGPAFSSTRMQTSPGGAAAASLPIPQEPPDRPPLAVTKQETAEAAPKSEPFLGEALKPANTPSPAKKVTAQQRPQNLTPSAPKSAPPERSNANPMLFAGLVAVLAVVVALGIAWWLRGDEQASISTEADFVAEGTRASTAAPSDPLTLIEPLDDAATAGGAVATLGAPETPALAGGTAIEPAAPDLGSLPAVTQSGILQLSPEVAAPADADRIDRLYVASIDRVVLTYDAIALPAEQLAPSDVALPVQPLPPSADTTFVFDENGLVVPTPGGTLSPEGIRVYAGAPTVVPLVRPGTSITTTTAALSPERLEALSRIVPLARPENLAEGTERAQNSGLSLAELRSIRPMPRPAAVARVAELIARQAPTEQAVLASLTPAPRPGNLRGATPAPTSTAPAATAPAAAPSQTAVAPRQRVPSGASVAQAATIDNGLALHTVNVIGIYGTAKQRRALVRLANGRIVMVSVGERLDGGRVAAINETTLVYVKSGRNIALNVPNG